MNNENKNHTSSEENPMENREGSLCSPPEDFKTTEQQVEELEKEFSENTYDKLYCNLLIKKAKDLKAEIKGCGERITISEDGTALNYECGMFRFLCPKCQNLIDRLNKIIGEKE